MPKSQTARKMNPLLPLALLGGVVLLVVIVYFLGRSSAASDEKAMAQARVEGELEAIGLDPEKFRENMEKDASDSKFFETIASKYGITKSDTLEFVGIGSDAPVAIWPTEESVSSTVRVTKAFWEDASEKQKKAIVLASALLDGQEFETMVYLVDNDGDLYPEDPTNTDGLTLVAKYTKSGGLVLLK